MGGGRLTSHEIRDQIQVALPFLSSIFLASDLPTFEQPFDEQKKNLDPKSICSKVISGSQNQAILISSGAVIRRDLVGI